MPPVEEITDKAAWLKEHEGESLDVTPDHCIRYEPEYDDDELPWIVGYRRSYGRRMHLDSESTYEKAVQSAIDLFREDIEAKLTATVERLYKADLEELTRIGKVITDL